MAESLGTPKQYIGSYKTFKKTPEGITLQTGDWGLEAQTKQMQELLGKAGLL